MPLRFDMPLQALEGYMGSSPRPADFDVYWDRALAELADTEANAEWVPAAFRTAFADCDHLYFSGVRGARVHAKVVRPRHLEGAGPAVLRFHGYSGNAGDWVDLLGYAAQGFTVAAMDCRGQGGLSLDPGGHVGSTFRGHIVRGLDGPADDMLFRQVFLDTVQLARVVMALPSVDAGRVMAMGSSQGGGLTLACAALEPRVQRAAPVYPFLSDYRRVWEMDLTTDAYRELQDYFRRHDPLHIREDEVFEKLGYIDIQHLAPRIRAAVLMGVGLMDQVCPPSSQYAAYNRITSPKQLRLYPDFGHENLPGHADAVFAFLSHEDGVAP